jgi:carbamate kinase
MSQAIVVAMGGNSLLDPGLPPTVENQFAVTLRYMQPVADLIAEGKTLVLTHGNGPQVGFMQLRSEIARDQVHEVPLDSLVANSQGSLGYMIQRDLRQTLQARNIPAEVATIVTEVEVDPADPAFAKPTKPVGKFYSAEQAEEFKITRGWQVVEDAGRGWRRVVPSPQPKLITQLSTIKKLIDLGITVICCGGGGIPIAPGQDGRIRGIEAVIDKDRASALLAIALKAPTFVVTTGVDVIYADFKKPTQRALPTTTVSELKALHAQGQFPAGSMGPKVEAVIDYLEAGGDTAIICRPEHLALALQGKAGTRIFKD